jgi:hypothetical protein
MSFAPAPLRFLSLLALMLPAAPTLASEAVTLELLSRHVQIIEIYLGEHKDYTELCEGVRTSPRKSQGLLNMCRDRFTEIADKLERENQRLGQYLDHPDLSADKRIAVRGVYEYNQKLVKESRETAKTFQ